MSECLNAVGFVFNSVKTYIKKDNKCRYSNAYCQMCICNNQNCGINNGPSIIETPRIISPCNKCTNNTQYKICIFKLKKEHFVSSSLEISTSSEDAWEVFKKNIIYQRNGNFIISITKCNNTLHSFYANMIKAKKCGCCDSVILYFKYNIISLESCYQLTNPITYPDETQPQPSPYINVCANYESNITYNLKSGLYKSVRFFNSPNYNYENYIANCYPCVWDNQTI
jgi:hypothetical protein